MFWKSVNGREPDNCSDPIDLSKMTANNETYGSHVYDVIYNGDQHSYIIGTASDMQMSWRMASDKECNLIIAFLAKQDDEPVIG